MSIFQSISTNCPACGKPLAVNLVESLNADRRPDLREAILEGSFQRETCNHCGVSFRLEPSFSYVDQARGQWLLIQPIEHMAQWQELERHARELFDDSFGEHAMPMVREIGARLSPRVCFGWPALTEKLLCVAHGLDDVGLELTKIALLRGLEGQPLADDHELRLAAVDDSALHMVWLESPAERVIESLKVPRDLYDETVTEPEWQALRERLAGHFFIDIDRLLVPTPEELAAPVGAAEEDAS